MFKKFKEFAFKGNVIDLAVGVVIGGAFGKIVTALVEHIITPLIGILTGGTNVSAWHFKVGDAVVTYGAFLQAVLDFLIIAASIFAMITIIGKFRESAEKLARKIKAEEEAAAQTEAEAAPPAPTEAELLAEIRDLLKQNAEK